MDRSKFYSRKTGIKRLLNEAVELAVPNEEYHAMPLEDNLYEWHFTIRGAPATEFANGYYHGRILLPHEYPMKPPNIILLTPNGRFQTNTKICLSISDYHPESWRPSWSIRTALLALIAFMPTNSHGSIGSLHLSKEDRRQLALKSQYWHCSICGRIADKLKPPKKSSVSVHSSDSVIDGDLRHEILANMENNEIQKETEKRHKKSFVFNLIIWIIIVILIALLIRRLLDLL